MKKILMTILAMAAASATLQAADQGAVNFRVSTQGPDHYADGTQVQDGESYALVWTRTGATFAGITLDGKAVGNQDDNYVIACQPLASAGHCPTWRWAMNAETAAKYVGTGAFSVHVLDTRKADGTPGGKEWGLNAYGSSQAFTIAKGTTIQKVPPASVTSAEHATVVPDSVPAPKIKSIEVKNGIVRLTVEKTSKLLRYGVSSGDDPATLVADATFPKKDGNDEADIVIEAPSKGSGGFFKVGRAPLK